MAYLFLGGWSQRCSVAYAVLMRVTVLYFGVLKDLMEHRSMVIELAEGASIGELLALHRGSGKASVWDSIAVAVNQEYAQAGYVLKDGDEVALLPPVSGGCGRDNNKSKGEIQGPSPFDFAQGQDDKVLG
jgi:molybdopterin converting factor subunit 1